MTKQRNSVNLFQVFDEVCNAVASITLSPNTTTTTTGIHSGDLVGFSTFTPNVYWDMPSTTIWETIPITPIDVVPDYPKTNGYILPNGDTVIEIAVTGFEREELKVNREDQTLIVTGKKQRTKENDDRRYLYHHIAERDFEYKVTCSDKQNLDDIKVTLAKGKMVLTIPLKEAARPIKKEIKIE